METEIADALIANLFTTEETLAKELFEGRRYPWEVLPLIREFILRLGETLPAGEYERRGEAIWVARDAKVAESAFLAGPCIIDHEAEVRHCAFVRGSALIGKQAVVGNSTELKNVILFNRVQVPHYNYVGDSILGFRSHMGAGSITSNVKSDKTNVVVKQGDVRLETGMRKFGAMLGDYVEIGCGSVLNPGTVVGRNSSVYPLSSVRGVIPPDRIYKKQGEIVERQTR